jgi:hypothetical protein
VSAAGAWFSSRSAQPRLFRRRGGEELAHVYSETEREPHEAVSGEDDGYLVCGLSSARQSHRMGEQLRRRSRRDELHLYGRSAECTKADMGKRQKLRYQGALGHEIQFSCEHDEWERTVTWTEEIVERWLVHPVFPLEVIREGGDDDDRYDVLACWGTLGTMQHFALSVAGGEWQRGEAPPIVASLELMDLDDDEALIRYEDARGSFRGDPRALKLPRFWGPHCGAPFIAIVEGLLDGDWPPVFDGLQTLRPTPRTVDLSCPDVAEGGNAYGHYAVDRWYDSCRIDLRAALSQVKKGRCPFHENDDAFWSVEEVRGDHVFSVPLMAFAWRYELEFHAEPLWLPWRRDWVEITVNQEGDLLEPRLMSTDYVGDIEDDDEFTDLVSEVAYAAYADLAEEFFVKP